jgi:hypothetical protein
MLEFPIRLIPGVGIEAARFGESRDEHRSALGDFEPFIRQPGDTSADIYVPSMVVLEYDENDRLVYLQVADNRATVYWEDIQLSDEPVERVRAAMRARGHEPVTVVDVDFYPKLSLRLGVEWTDLGGPNEDREGDLVREISLIQEETELEGLQRKLREQGLA